MASTRDDRPQMQWIEVTDARGGTRLEARWSVPGQTALAVPAVATAHAA